jgi:small subunit ribosomal protein S6
MTTGTEAPPIRLYECMFLLSQAEAANLAAALDHINEILARGQVDVLAIKKWDERRLAYEIDKQKRGVFILCYFKATGEAIDRIERDSAMSEHVMRVMVVRADHMTEDQARAADDRDNLMNEARLRSEKAATAQAEQKTGARLGAPTKEEMGQTEEVQEAQAEAAGEKPAEAAATESGESSESGETGESGEIGESSQTDETEEPKQGA